MKKLLIALFMSAFSIGAMAQTATVTGTATDADGQTWNNGTWRAVLVSPNGPPTISRVPVTPTTVTGSFNGSGALSTVLTRTDALDQSGATWQFTICPNASADCASPVSTAIAGASVSVSSTLSTGLAGPRFNASTTAYGYLDVEVNKSNLKDGQTYFNVTSGVIRSYSSVTQTWTGTGGGGTPAGTTGAMQYNNNGAFGGLNGTGIPMLNGASAPTIATAGTDFLSPTACNNIVTGGGIPCVQTLGTGQMKAVYDLTPKGTTVGQSIPDQLGNATFAIPWPGANAPTQTQQGLVFDGSTTSILNVPAAVTGVAAVSVFFSQYADNYQSGGAGSTYPQFHTLFSGSVVGGQGMFFAVNMNTGIGTGGKYYSQMFCAGNSTTQVWQPVVGPGMMTFIPGSPDTIAVNDKFGVTYIKQGNCITNWTGPYGIGANISVGGRTFLGTISYVVLWSTAPTAAQVAALYQKTSQIMTVGNGGASLWRAQAAGAGVYLMCGVDSHTSGSGPTTWCSTTNMPSLSPSPNTIVIAASSGKHATEAVPELSEVFYENVPPTASQAAYIDDQGTNDLLNVDMTVAQLQTFYVAAGVAAHKAGLKYIVQTYFDMCPGGAFPGNIQTENAWIRQHWREFADGISDVGADKILGVSGASCSGPNTYWDASKYHLTNAGKTVEGLVPQAAWNNLWGSTISSPTTLTATASITSGQNFVQSTCGSACTLTLPDATNNCGASFSIHSMGVGVTSYAPAGTDTIDGSGSTVPMTFGDVITFTSQFNNNVAAPSCSWAVTNK